MRAVAKILIDFEVADSLAGRKCLRELAELLEPVLTKGQPREAAFAALDRLADEILAKHKEAGIVN